MDKFHSLLYLFLCSFSRSVRLTMLKPVKVWLGLCAHWMGMTQARRCFTELCDAALQHCPPLHAGVGQTRELLVLAATKAWNHVLLPWEISVALRWKCMQFYLRRCPRVLTAHVMFQCTKDTCFFFSNEAKVEHHLLITDHFVFSKQNDYCKAF